MAGLADYMDPSTGFGLKIRKGNAVYHALKGAILLRGLHPGDAIGEQQVAGEFGCSQGTVREALLRLQEDGLVQRLGYRGTFVSATTIVEAAELAIIRIRLESEGIRRAALDFSDQKHQTLVDILERMETANDSGDLYAVSELDRQFHLVLFQSANMPTLEPVLNRCTLHMHRYTFSNHTELDRTDSPVAAHAPILNALQSGNPDEAASVIKDHIEAVLRRWSPELLDTIRNQRIG